MSDLAPLDRLSAAILAGGASRRMGRDKALLTLGGRTLLERTIEAVSHVADDVMIIGDREPYQRFGTPVFGDRFPGTGPLGGIATALHHARHEYVLIVACDMPFLSARLLEAMAGVPRGYDVLLPIAGSPHERQSGTTTYETLHAIYRRTCLGPIERRLADGELKAFQMFAEMSVHELSEEWLRRYDPSLESFVNANRPDDWERVRARMDTEQPTVEGHA